MNTTVYKIIVLTVLFANCGIAQSQSIDEERMKRDLEVAKNILITLADNGISGYKFSTYHGVDGNYVPGYGVILNLPQYLNISIASATTIHGNVIVLDRSTRKTQDPHTKANTHADSIAQLKENATIDLMKIFLMDYADLINQLSPEHKILVVSRNNRRYSRDWDRDKGSPKTSAEITKKDLTAYKQGKISREKLEGLIRVTKSETRENVPRDMELMASILNRLYKSDLSKTYFTGGVKYDFLPSFGVVYTMKTYYSDLENLQEHVRLPYSREQSTKKLPPSERDQKIKKLYPIFLEDLKSNMASYGRTLNSLKDDEMFTIKVELTRCSGCGIPERVELAIKASHLKAFERGKISEKDVLARILVRESGKQ